MNDQMKRPRGRPRPQEAIDRDRAVLRLLKDEGPLTRNQIAERLTAEKVKVYLSLNRLRSAGQVRTCASGAPGQVLWSAKADQPCP